VTEKTDPQTQTAIRLPDSLLARLDKLAERMSEPGMRVTRTEVLRLAVFRGASELEAEKGRKR
jgi:predicted transcriptional regulator